jgi:chaperonin cofactor prefoldin
LAQLATTLGGALLQAVQALAPVMPQIAEAFAQLAAAVGQGLAAVLPVLVQAFVALVPIIVQLVPPMLQIVQAIIPLIPAAAQLAAALLQVVVAGAPLLNILGQIIAFLAQLIAKVVEMGVNLVTAGVEPFQKFVAVVQESFTQVVSFVTSGIDQVVALFQSLGPNIASIVSDFGSLLISAGKDLIQGLINGIKSMAGAAVQAARDVASSVVGAVKGFLGISSPSKVFHGLGTDTVAGFTNGIGDSQHLAEQRAATMAQGVVDSASEVIAGIGPFMVDIQLDPAALEQLKAEKDLLELQEKTLRVQKDQTVDKMAKTALQAQIDQITARQREIALIREQTEYQKKYGEQVTATEADYSSQINSMAKLPYDFANANANQFLGDLGIGGNGALSTAAKWGLDFGSQFVFNVNGVGEGQPNAGECKGREYYWVEMESTSCSYEVFDETYVQSVLDQWVAKFPELAYEYSVHNLDVEPDVFIQAGGVS